MIRIERNTTRLIVIFFAIHWMFFVYGSFVEAPRDFVKGKTITIPENFTAKDTVRLLKEEEFIVSPSLLLGIFYTTGTTDEVNSGEYLFSRPESVFRVHQRLTNGIFNIPFVSLRVQEGLHNRDIAKAVSDTFPHISEELFISLTSELEGKLHPDTYKFHYNEKVERVIETLTKRQEEILSEFNDLIERSEFTSDEVLTLASIVERESHDKTDRRYIAGILLNRLNDNIPLQVDVVFYYINGKNSFNLTLEELREDHPYNTYTRNGLPPTPIGAPSRESILAVLNPINSDFYYFIADKNGKTHYSITYEEHLEKKGRFQSQ